MSIQIEDIIDELYNKYNIPKADIARIVKSQFKVLKNTIKAKGDKVVNLRYIGKYKPTPYRVKQLKGLIDVSSKQIQGDSIRLEEPGV